MLLERVASIVSAHGLAGELSLISYVANYSSLKEYSPLTDKTVDFNIINIRSVGGRVIAKIEHVNSRTEAEHVVGVDLFTERNKFPQLDFDDFFLHDLINISLVLEDGQEYGVIVGCYNFGAGELVEVRLKDEMAQTIFLPFNKQHFPLIKKGCVLTTVILS